MIRYTKTPADTYTATASTITVPVIPTFTLTADMDSAVRLFEESRDYSRAIMLVVVPTCGTLRTSLFVVLVTLAEATNSYADTLRMCLASFGYSLAATATGAPSLDRELTNDSCQRSDATANEFVAVYWYADEQRGQLLGPVHVSLFDRRQARWIHAPNIYDQAKLAGLDFYGAVGGAKIESLFISIGAQTMADDVVLLLDRSLHAVGSFCGSDTHALHDGSMFFAIFTDLRPSPS